MASLSEESYEPPSTLPVLNDDDFILFLENDTLFTKLFEADASTRDDSKTGEGTKSKSNNMSGSSLADGTIQDPDNREARQEQLETKGDGEDGKVGIDATFDVHKKGHGKEPLPNLPKPFDLKDFNMTEKPSLPSRYLAKRRSF